MVFKKEESFCVQLRDILIYSLLVLFCVVTSKASANDVYFACDSNGVKYQVFKNKNDEVVYIHQKNNKTDFMYSEVNGYSRFWLASVPFSGGGMAYIFFSQNNYDYYLYQAMAYNSEPVLDVLGVMVWHEGRMISNRTCNGEGNGLSNLAHKNLPKIGVNMPVLEAVVAQR